MGVLKLFIAFLLVRQLLDLASIFLLGFIPRGLISLLYANSVSDLVFEANIWIRRNSFRVNWKSAFWRFLAVKGETFIQV